ncbi:MAG: Sec-independent protein translocase protein TatB [Steroidobacteraceae bacterium]
MFDFGFSEILLIFVLALVVLGPEKLPTVVRRVGRWVGRARAMARQFQEQLEEEIDFDGRRRPSPPEPSSVAPEDPSAPAQAAESASPGAESATRPFEPATTVEPTEFPVDRPDPEASGEPAGPNFAPGAHEPRV